ncbi:MAG: hypothetical protein DSM107014_04670 [Gomphosphaeria aponina SAG 52.96 = DSM 107014]|uniref:Uncharacterized protein n=1 Tax=Gomphosphaeria aponina SAG 52.96 = DSM 107014 TaxID=1521640 RepID=A0A941GU56_9CHRO|nr:hypothetical protein [Gomphosphaeria aponina SAG 52.96 = DSM 107014]
MIKVFSAGEKLLKKSPISLSTGNLTNDSVGGGKWNQKNQQLSGGQIWFTPYEISRNLLELYSLRYCQANWLDYHDMNGKPVMNEIDYDQGYIHKTPDNYELGQNPFKPLSIGLDLQ